MTYSVDEISILREVYVPSNPRTWPYYPIVMPLKDGQGPSSDAECDKITWEVWDRCYNTVGQFDCLPDAIECAMTKNAELFGESHE